MFFQNYHCFYTCRYNLVAQLCGRKRWMLFSPDDSARLYPTRVPFEELSVFSQVNVQRPNLEEYPLFNRATPYQVRRGKINGQDSRYEVLESRFKIVLTVLFGEGGEV